MQQASFPNGNAWAKEPESFMRAPFFAFGAIAKNLLKKYYGIMGYFIAYTDLKCAIKFIAARFEFQRHRRGKGDAGNCLHLTMWKHANFFIAAIWRVCLCKAADFHRMQWGSLQ